MSKSLSEKAGVIQQLHLWYRSRRARQLTSEKAPGARSAQRSALRGSLESHSSSLSHEAGATETALLDR